MADPTVRPDLDKFVWYVWLRNSSLCRGYGGCITWLIGRYKGSVSARTNFASDADSIYHTHHATHSTNRTLIHDWGHHTMMGCN